jgi:S-adenosylmethionine:diacylglycerol 3-amino-3-carboxypropyl transferase
MIWYSHINEDSSVERKQLSGEHFKTICCVSGSGERLIALLDHPADTFYAIDVNPEALLLLQLKLQALKELAVEEYLSFIGHTRLHHEKRIEIYNSFKNQLSHECRNYWDDHIRWIGNGILNIGHYERYLARLRPMLRFFLGSGFDHVFDNGDDSGNDFPKLRWQILNALFSNRWTYKLSGNRDISFVGPGADNKKISEGLNSILKEGSAKDSYVFHQIFRGTLNGMEENVMPVSLQKKHLQAVREKLKKGLKINYIQQDYDTAILESVLTEQHSTFHSLSDIIGFENDQYIKNLLAKILSKPGNKAVIRSFLINPITENFFTGAGIEKDAWEDLSASESTGMYQVFSVKSNK